MKNVRRQQGFTLIELMIVVGILGILAALAMSNFTRATLRARQVEALTLLGTIKNQQFAFFATHDCFASTERTPDGPPEPNTRLWVSAPTGYDDPCSGDTLSFDDVSVRPSHARVFFSYECVATTTGINGASDTEFTCSAEGDLDGNGDLYELVFCTDNAADGAGLPSPAGTPCTFPWEPTRLSVDIY